MAGDVVDSVVLETTPAYYKVRLTNVSDGTGESAVAKIDKSGLTDKNGAEPRRLVVMYMKWSIQGFTSVRLFFDHTTDDELAVLANNGERDYSADGGFKDPGSSGGTGDILLTTAGAVSGATYDIELIVRLDPKK